MNCPGCDGGVSCGCTPEDAAPVRLCDCGAPVTVGTVAPGIPDDFCRTCFLKAWAMFEMPLGLVRS